MIFLKDMKSYLDEQEIGIPFFVGALPETPVNCIALLEYQGLPPEGNATVTPGMQLLLRVQEEDFEQGYEQLYATTTALLKIGQQDGELSRGIEINSTLYLLVYTLGDGFNQMGKDENGNLLISKNLYVVRGGI